MIWVASVAIGKDISMDDLYYSDYMNGNENLTEEVWEYVEECGNIGMDAFKEKYSDYKLY